MSKLKIIAIYGLIGGAIFLIARTSGWYVQRRPVVQLQQQIRSTVETWSGYSHYDFQILNAGLPDERIADVDEPELTKHWLSDRLGNDWFHDLRYVTFAQFDGVPEDGGQAAPRSEITDETIRPLLECSTIDWWALSGTAITDEIVAELAERTEPKRLWLGQTQISDASLQALSNCQGLELLALESTSTTDQGLQALSKIESLKSLSLGSPFYTASGLRYLSDLGNLEELYLDRLPISAALPSLGKLRKLRILSMRGTGVGNAQMVHLAGLQELSRVHLDGTLTGDIGLQVAKHWPKLQTLTLQGTLVSDAGLEHLSDCGQLERLRLSDTGCSLSGILDLLVNRQGHTLEQALSIVFDTKMDATGELLSVDLGDIVIRDSDIKHLRELKSLRWLYLANNELTKEGVRNIARLGLDQLELLNVNGADIDDSVVESLLELPALRNLHVVETGISEAGVQAARKQRPALSIYRQALR